jgi:hypothetical protein
MKKGAKVIRAFSITAIISSLQLHDQDYGWPQNNDKDNRQEEQDHWHS